MPVPLIIAGVATVASAGMQAVAASKKASAVARAADYNAKVDIANAQQLQMDAEANVRRQRQENQDYLSKIRVAYAASGVLSDTGTPMQVLGTTAARQEQDIQQYWTGVNQKTDRYYASALEGVAEGHDAASAYHLEGAADIIKGIGSIAGMFAGVGTSTTTPKSFSGGWAGQDSGSSFGGYT